MTNIKTLTPSTDRKTKNFNNKKTNLFYLAERPFSNIKYSQNNKMYISNNGILKEDFCNSKSCTVEKIFNDTSIDLSFNVEKYFKVNTKIEPWADPLYLYYFNNRHINVELENNDDIIITRPTKGIEDIYICFQTLAQCGVYKTVMKYNCSKIVKELDCELWAPLDIRKPFKLVKKQSLVNLEITKDYLYKDINKRVIGEIKQEYATWYIYHPLQLRTTLLQIYSEKNEIEKMEKGFLKKRTLNNLKNECKELKELFFNNEKDEEHFLANYAQFWF